MSDFHRCEQCGQRISEERAQQSDYCERCGKARRTEQLEEQVDELQEELSEMRRALDAAGTSEVDDAVGKLRELIAYGCSSAQAVDYLMVELHGVDIGVWAKRRRVSKSAIYNNLSAAESTVEQQSTVPDFTEDESTEEPGDESPEEPGPVPEGAAEANF